MGRPLPASWLTNDPGDIHCGVAKWAGSALEWADEMTVEEYVALLEDLTGLTSGRRLIELLVQEKFTLYGWKAHEQVGSEMLTSQLIGVSKYICQRAGVHYLSYRAKEVKLAVKEQQPYASMTAKDWRARGARRVNSHVKDAIVHGDLFIKRRDRER